MIDNRAQWNVNVSIHGCLVIDSTRYHFFCRPTCKECFLSGDTRTNEQYMLTSLHTIFMREHNHLARRLAVINPAWEDEKLYQVS